MKLHAFIISPLQVLLKVQSSRLFRILPFNTLKKGKIFCNSNLNIFLTFSLSFCLVLFFSEK